MKPQTSDAAFKRFRTEPFRNVGTSGGFVINTPRKLEQKKVRYQTLYKFEK
jgi:hypothetical protein